MNKPIEATRVRGRSRGGGGLEEQWEVLPGAVLFISDLMVRGAQVEPSGLGDREQAPESAQRVQGLRAQRR